MSLMYTIVHHTYFNGVYIVGMRLRIACSALLYRKALKLSNTALGQTTVGQMVNLLSNDVNRCNNDSTTYFLCRFDLSVLFNHYLWCGPLQLVIVTVLLYQRIGPSSLVVGLLSSESPPILSRGWCCW